MAFSVSRIFEKIIRAIFRALLNLLRRILAVIVAFITMLFLGLLAAITKGWHRLTDRTPKPPA